MIDALVSLLKDNLRLSAPLPILAAIAIGVALLYARRTARWGRWWLTAVIATYWLLSTPMGAWLVSWPLAAGQPRITSREQAGGARAIVVLGGGIVSQVAGSLAIDDLRSSALRVIEGVRLYQLLGDAVLIMSGGNTMHRSPPRLEADALRTAAVTLGVPPADITVEDAALTTREQALAIKRLADQRHFDRIVLVTAPAHMPRSLAAFRAAGVNAIPSAAPLRGEPDHTFWTLNPDRDSLNISDLAVYEYGAWIYYAWRGWV
jgi:uncharacterized SAM-binding protein YcdF (DUF218 family)